MTDRRPIRKLNVGALSGALTVLLLAALRAAGLDLDAEVAGALGVVLDAVVQAAAPLVVALLAAYATPDERVAGSSHPSSPPPTP